MKKGCESVIPGWHRPLEVTAIATVALSMLGVVWQCVGHVQGWAGLGMMFGVLFIEAVIVRLFPDAIHVPERRGGR